MSCVELAWTRDGNRFTHIDARIVDLVGWTAEEIAVMARPLAVLAPDCQGLLEGPPGRITATQKDSLLRHKNGDGVHCQMTAVCRYDGNGRLAEAWGCICQIPQQGFFNQFAAWWKEATDEARQVIMNTTTLYPSPVTL